MFGAILVVKVQAVSHTSKWLGLGWSLLSQTLSSLATNLLREMRNNTKVRNRQALKDENRQGNASNEAE